MSSYLLTGVIAVLMGMVLGVQVTTQNSANQCQRIGQILISDTVYDCTPKDTQ